jgi:hypothetical protein
LTIQQASLTQHGYLSKEDFAVFNSKQSAFPATYTITSTGITNSGNLSICSSGGNTLSLDNDGDGSIINIGYYNGSTTTQNKTINIGDVNDSTINLNGNYVNLQNKLRIGNDASALTNDLSIQTTNNTSLISNYCNKVGGGGRASFSNGAWGGGVIHMISNATGSSYLGIPASNSGLSSNWGDMIIATGNNGASSQRLQIKGDGTGVFSSVDIIPTTNNGNNIGSTSNKWNNGHITTLNSSTGNITTLQNCTDATITTLNSTTGNIATLSSTNATVSGQVSTGKVIFASGIIDLMEISGTTITPYSSGLTIDATNVAGVDIKGSNGLKINGKKIQFVVIPTGTNIHFGPIEFKTEEYMCIIAGTHPSTGNIYNGAKIYHNPNDPSWWYLQTWGMSSVMVMAIPLELCGADPYWL